jgi:hypothetical protein
MPRVSWSEKARQELEGVVTSPAVRNQIMCNAELALHDPYVPDFPCAGSGDSGAYGEVMWHRATDHGDDHEWLPEPVGDGPQNYFLFYRRSGDSAAEFEVLAVRSIQQVANFWEQLSREPAEGADLLFARAEPASGLR